MSKNQASLSGWPNGPMSEELIKKVDETKYDDLTLHEKLAWVQRKLGLLESPNDMNTKLNKADEKIERTYKALDDIFERLWFTVKEDELGRAIHKCYMKFYEKRGKIRKFESQVYKFKKHQEWLKKQEAYKRKKAFNKRY